MFIILVLHDLMLTIKCQTGFLLIHFQATLTTSHPRERRELAAGPDGFPIPVQGIRVSYE